VKRIIRGSKGHPALRCELFGTENLVAGVTQSGKNIAILVESLIDGGDVNINVRVALLQLFDPLGGGGPGTGP